MTGTRNGTATAALVVAIAGLALCWSVIGGLACGIVAFVLGVVGRGRVAGRRADNSEFATAGMALGVVAVLASVAFAVVWGLTWRDSGGSAYLDCAVRAGNDQKAVEACTNHWLDQFTTKYGISSPGSTRGST